MGLRRYLHCLLREDAMMPQTCPGSVVSTHLVRSPRGLIALLVGLALAGALLVRRRLATEAA